MPPNQKQEFRQQENHTLGMPLHAKTKKLEILEWAWLRLQSHGLILDLI